MYGLILINHIRSLNNVKNMVKNKERTLQRNK